MGKIVLDILWHKRSLGPIQKVGHKTLEKVQTTATKILLALKRIAYKACV